MTSDRITELYEQAHEDQPPVQGAARLTKSIMWGQPKKFNPELFAELLLAEYADGLVLNAMADPRYAAAMDKFYENKWGHRFD